MAHKKGGGTTRNGRDSKGQRLGIKRYDGETVRAGTIILRQRGTKIFEGTNVGRGRDFTLYSLIDGTVKFEHQARSTRHQTQSPKRVSVYPSEA